METKRMIPYSVHLREDIYLKLKDIAKDRKATALVRDAITMIVEGDDSFSGGYKKAVRDVVGLIQFDEWAGSIGIGGQSISDRLISKIERLTP